MQAREVLAAGPFLGWPSADGFDHFDGFLNTDHINFVLVVYENKWPTNPSVGYRDFTFQPACPTAPSA